MSERNLAAKAPCGCIFFIEATKERLSESNVCREDDENAGDRITAEEQGVNNLRTMLNGSKSNFVYPESREKVLLREWR